MPSPGLLGPAPAAGMLGFCARRLAQATAGQAQLSLPGGGELYKQEAAAAAQTLMCFDKCESSSPRRSLSPKQSLCRFDATALVQENRLESVGSFLLPDSALREGGLERGRLEEDRGGRDRRARRGWKAEENRGGVKGGETRRKEPRRSRMLT